jgi:hypothetical protein
LAGSVTARSSAASAGTRDGSCIRFPFVVRGRTLIIRTALIPTTVATGATLQSSAGRPRLAIILAVFRTDRVSLQSSSSDVQLCAFPLCELCKCTHRRIKPGPAPRDAWDVIAQGCAQG